MNPDQALGGRISGMAKGRALAEALRSGDLKIEDDESAVESFLTLFPLPEPAATAEV